MNIRTNNLNMPMRRKEYLIWTIFILLLATIMWVHHSQEIALVLSPDEAFNAIEALDLVLEGNPRIFYSANWGREPMHIYIQTLTITLLGTSPWALHFFISGLTS